MAGMLHRLTAKTVQSSNAPGRHADGGNLYLQVTASGSKSWLFMYRLNGRQREMGLGSAALGAITLAEARDRAAEARKLLETGHDPLEARKASEAAEKAASTTFGEFADKYIQTQKPGWRNDKHVAQWEMTLGDTYCSAIRTKPIGTITVQDILDILNPHWQRVPETTRRLRMRLEKVLDAAKVHGLRSGDNPARWRGHLEHLLPKHTNPRKGHHAAISFEVMPAFLERLRQLSSVSAKAVEFTILTAARTGEVILATWAEIDFQNKVWTIPAERMKAGREHRVPLSEAALAVLQAMKGKDDTWVFPGQTPKKPLSNMAMLMLLRGIGHEETVHGFRSSFRDWASETTSYPREVVEMALAHAIENKTEAAYRRGDLFEKRRKLMADWAGFIASPPVGKVVPLKIVVLHAN